jgi:lysophospholipase L1-like esterase
MIEGVVIFDAAKILADDSGKMKPEYSLDELHSNEQGYQVLNSELIKLLEKIR